MANIMSIEKRNAILRLLVEGNSIRSITRLMETNIRTVLRRLTWAGEHCKALSDERLTGLKLRHVECDEIWTFVQKKQARLTTEERAVRSDIGDIFLWTGVDQDTKLIPAYVIGKRSADNARRFMNDLASRLVFPTAHGSDAHAFLAGGHEPIVQISSDGFAAYPEAVDLAIGPYARFGRSARITATPR